MSDHHPTSGSRREPTAPVPAPVPADVPEPADAGSSPPADLADPPRRTTTGRHRLGLAAAAAGLVAAGGLGGFAVGHATGGEPDRGHDGVFDSGFERHGTPPDVDGDGHRFPPGGGPGFPAGRRSSAGPAAQRAVTR